MLSSSFSNGSGRWGNCSVSGAVRQGSCLLSSQTRCPFRSSVSLHAAPHRLGFSLITGVSLWTIRPPGPCTVRLEPVIIPVWWHFSPQFRENLKRSERRAVTMRKVFKICDSVTIGGVCAGNEEYGEWLNKQTRLRLEDTPSNRSVNNNDNGADDKCYCSVLIFDARCRVLVKPSRWITTKQKNH